MCVLGYQPPKVLAAFLSSLCPLLLYWDYGSYPERQTYSLQYYPITAEEQVLGRGGAPSIHFCILSLLSWPGILIFPQSPPL